ncbi:chemotaxis response regulator protein-glutamate methylesterase [Synergistales bacterium]|nr:chemotaxis response regulator protein-glutamate methylesterase [Synergistales bacterium]
MSGKKIRVLVADDSAFMRKIIGDILAVDPNIEVVGRARNGIEAIVLLSELRPDVMTLDMDMPGKNGIEVLREIMSANPTPIIMVSSLTKEGANVTMQALKLGAVDFVTKPSGTISLDMKKVGGELIQKVKGASRAMLKNALIHPVPQKTASFASMAKMSDSHTPPPLPRREITDKPELVVIGASTGGPNALQTVIPALPADFPLPILIVQHMPSGFTTSFAQRLNENSELAVSEACEGMPVRKGAVLIAPGGYHLVVERHGAELLCGLRETPPVRSVRPAADVLFKSVAETTIGSTLAVVLTGMGKDGYDGVKLLRAKGAYVLVESKETCVVYGMPGAIAGEGLADEILPIDAMAEGIGRAVRQMMGAR